MIWEVTIMSSVFEEAVRKFEGSGNGFVYGSGKLGRSGVLSVDDIRSIGEGKGNRARLFVKCRRCDVWMDFTDSGDKLLNGFWTCPVCGVKVREQTAYASLERENEEWLKKNT
jgi:hypothetical protein